MEKQLQVLSKSRLFQGMEPKEIEEMLGCIGGKIQVFKKKASLLMAGDAVDSMGILLKGKIQIIHEDITGNRRLLEELGPGDIFAETMACLGLRHSPFSAIAAEDGEALFIPFGQMLKTCSSACDFHNRLIKNMMHLMAEKNWFLQKKVELLSLRTTREKLMRFFLNQGRKAGSLTFTLPFSRAEMADFLSVDRSAMCRELGKMQKDGLIAVDRRTVRILKNPQ